MGGSGTVRCGLVEGWIKVDRSKETVAFGVDLLGVLPLQFEGLLLLFPALGFNYFLIDAQTAEIGDIAVGPQSKKYKILILILGKGRANSPTKERIVSSAYGHELPLLDSVDLNPALGDFP